MPVVADNVEHPTSAIFSRSDRLGKALYSLCCDVERINQELSGVDPSKEPTEKTEISKPPFLEDVRFRFDGHIREVEKIQEIVSTIKSSLITAPTIK